MGEPPLIPHSKEALVADEILKQTAEFEQKRILATAQLALYVLEALEHAFSLSTKLYDRVGRPNLTSQEEVELDQLITAWEHARDHYVPILKEIARGKTKF